MRDIILEGIDAGEAALIPRLHLVVNAALLLAQRLQLAAAVVNDTDGRSESEFEGTLADGERVLRMMNAAADYGIYVYVKIRMLGEQLQFLVENFQTLLRNFVGIHVVDGNLQPFESGTVEALDSFRDEQVAVGDEAGNHAVRANAADDVVEFGMQQRLAAGDGDHGRSQRA